MSACATKTVVIYYVEFRQIMQESIDETNYITGGQDVVVQINETKMGRIK